MKILIPSRARPCEQITAEALASANIDFIIVRTIGDKTIYPKEYEQIWVEANDLTDKRNVMLKMFPGKTFVLDDDISFFRTLPSGKTDDASNSDIRDIVNKMDDALDHYAHGGVARRYMIQNQPQPYALNKKPMGVRGYNTDLFPDPWPMFRYPNVEDIDFNMQLVKAGNPIWILTEYCQQDGPYMAPGGCQIYRNEAAIKKAMYQLRDEWPNYVKLREGPNQPGGTLATIYLAKLAKDYGAIR